MGGHKPQAANIQLKSNYTVDNLIYNTDIMAHTLKILSFPFAIHRTGTLLNCVVLNCACIWFLKVLEESNIHFNCLELGSS